MEEAHFHSRVDTLEDQHKATDRDRQSQCASAALAQPKPPARVEARDQKQILGERLGVLPRGPGLLDAEIPADQAVCPPDKAQKEQREEPRSPARDRARIFVRSLAPRFLCSPDDR